MSKSEPFKETHPNYKSYSSSEYALNEVPSELVDKICGIILRFHHQDQLSLKHTCDIAASYVPQSPTGNWGYDYLKSDLRDYLWSLHKKLPNFMDFLAALIAEAREIKPLIEEAFYECKFGYFLNVDPFTVQWLLKQEISDISAPITDAMEETRCINQATYERLELTLRKLQETDSLVGRKDAIREALYALESFLKVVTSTDDIKAADRSLRA